MRTRILLFAILCSCSEAGAPGSKDTSRAPLTQAGGLAAEYFGDVNLGARKFVRVDPQVDFDWGRDAPAPLIGADAFSIRWTGDVVPQFSETYTFSTITDDGVRLWVNGQLLVDDWHNHGATENRATIALQAGNRYAIRMEYYDAHYDAVAHLLWASASQPRQVIPSSRLIPPALGLRAEYYRDTTLHALALRRYERTIDFDWGTGSPDPAIGADNFSARFTGQVRPPSDGSYTFYTMSDDGVRLWIDGRLVIDNWTGHAPTENQATITLSASRAYDLRLEYYEAQFGAQIHLLWSGPGVPKAVIPAGVLTSPPENPGPYGLPTRSANVHCVAPPRPQGRGDVRLVRAFPNLTFQQPVALLQAPGDASRFFVVEKGGRVKAFANDPNVTTTSVFVDLGTRVNAGPQEAGLLGMAFDPGFATNHQAFLSYTAPSSSSPVNLRSTVARFTSADGGRTLDPNPDVVLGVDQPFENHNGGNIAFGPDGFLYLGLGDGGSAGDPNNNAQNTNVLFGKMLRIDVHGARPYAIPPDNPFAGGGGRREIYALGLRNPWRWSFDRANGELWVGDVGQDAWEEVDKIVRGGNYGWKIKEGTHCYGQNPCAVANLIDPVIEYSHADGISVTGGYVYRGQALPALYGAYVYGDFGSGRIWGLFPDATGGPQVLIDSGLNIASFGEDGSGELYVLDYATGHVFQLVAAPPTGTVNFPQTLSATGCFDSVASLTPALGVVPYDVNAALWSDGAGKQRFLALPDGTRIHAGEDGDWELPIGSVLLKTFSLSGTRVETRLFVRHADGGWAGYSYEWNDAQTDATLLADGKTKMVGAQTWTFPSRAQCMECHTAAAGYSLGLETAQLNRDLTYPNGTTANQLTTFDHIGLLDAAFAHVPADLPHLPVPSGQDAVTDRARSYLHGNCSFCHRPNGTGRGPADFRFATAFADVHVCNVAPTVGDLGVSGAKLLAPGDPAHSIISLRMHAQAGSGRMPPLATRVIDMAGSGLVDAWISSLAGCP